MELRGKVAIVTGGAVRLGKAIAISLAEAGIKIGLHYQNSSDEVTETLEAITALGSEAIGLQADFQNPIEAAATVVGKTVEKFQRVDILINNAAVFEEGTLKTATQEHWDRHFSINLKTPFFLCQEFAKQLAAGQRAHIVNIADRRATRPQIGHLPYTLTKSALVTMTECLALELAPQVQVNAIAPGAILPPPGEDQIFLDRIAQRVPLRRTGSPAEITHALLFLLRSDFVTGEIIHVTGGEHL